MKDRVSTGPVADPGTARVVVVQYADPWSVWSWGLEPVVRRLREVYGSALSFDLRMAGAIERFAEWRERMELAGPALVAWQREAAQRTGHPIDPECLTKGTFTSSFEACRAVKAAQLVASGAAPAYFRRLMEHLQVRSLPSDPRVLRQAARDVGIEDDRLATEWSSRRVAEAFQRDRAEMHRSGRTLLDVEYRRTDGEGTVVEGEFRSGPHERAVDHLVPGLVKRVPRDIEDYFRRHPDLIASREVGEVFGLTDSEAERELERLWSQGVLERWTYGGAPFWTLLRKPPR